MKNDIFWVDAFSAEPFGGNPAVVCVGTDDLPDTQLQHLANEFNVSESVFISGDKGEYSIRWFTPTKELPLVGHATLAAAHVVFSSLEPDRSEVRFFSAMSGELAAFQDRSNRNVAIVLPADDPVNADPPDALIRGLGLMPTATLKGRHYVAVFDDPEEVAALEPEFDVLETLDLPTIAVTARGHESDYVLRFFAPANGVPEDPVSGVAQCSLMPYWASKLGKSELSSRQLSPKGGEMHCKLLDAGVQIAGPCCTIFSGALEDC